MRVDHKEKNDEEVLSEAFTGVRLMTNISQISFTVFAGVISLSAPAMAYLSLFG